MKIVNKKFYRDYQEIETFEAGIVLTGSEVKSVRNRAINLEESYVKILADGLYLINAKIPLYKFSNHQRDYNPTRSRKLLLKKKEIIRIATKVKAGGLTIVPKSCYTKGKFLKLEIAIAKGRKDIEKRKLEKKRALIREKEKEAKEFLKN
ncbi:MAG: SsrA-binding protein SmpB [Patescibacteria group bacterium]|nr:SsrA-binding protein SmpB [Patescibacteria group bacterium]